MARIGGWAQPKNEEKEQVTTVKTETKRKKITKEKKTKERTIRMSTSSFESGTANDFAEAGVDEETTRSLGKKKHSVLGFGIPATMRFGSTRTLSTTSTVVDSQPTPTEPTTTESNPPVTKSSLNILTSRRPASTVSNASTLRPPSTVSAKSSGSGASVKWDEARLRTVRKMRHQDREEKRKGSTDTTATLGGKNRETRRSSDGSRRPLVSDIFPETQRVASPYPSSTISPKNAVEEATHGHGSPLETPVQRVRVKPRPMSEQMLGKPTRPPAVYDTIDPLGGFNSYNVVTSYRHSCLQVIYPCWMLLPMIWRP